MLEPLKKGEYDLVNISLLGTDPVTGRSYEECEVEWKNALNEVVELGKTLRWWQWKNA